MRFIMRIIITLSIGFAAMAQDENQPPAPLRPDVYPSRKSAASAMADQIADALPNALSFGQTITLIYSSNTVPSFISDLSDSLQARFPAVSVVMDQVYRHKPTNGPTINVVDISKKSTDSHGDYSAIITNPGSPSPSITNGDKPDAADWTPFASAMADQIAEALSKAPNVGPTITLMFATSNVPEITSDLAVAIQSRFPSVSVVIEQVYHRKPTMEPTTEPTTGTTMGSTTEPAINVFAISRSKSNTNAALSAIHAKPLNASLEVKYVDKPWAADWATFINTEAPHAWIVGKSNALCPNEDEADQIAYADAARQIVHMLRQRDAINLAGWDDDKLHNWVVRCLTNTNANAVNDKFVQHFDVNGDNPSWQESMLVSADDNTLTLMVVPLLNTRSPGSAITATPDAVRKIGPAITLVAIIFLLYLFLNWITKGYFSTRLKITLFAMLIIIGILLFLGVFFVGGRPMVVQPTATQWRN